MHFSHLDNISRDDKLAIHDLRTKDDINITTADNSGKIIIKDYASHLQEAYGYLIRLLELC